jgi:3-oxoacyl-(acyl-carrier-protein) synthase
MPHGVGAHLWEVLDIADQRCLSYVGSVRPALRPRAIDLALKDAGLISGYRLYQCAGSTTLNDKTETMAIKQVFGEHARQIPISGTKGLYGHPRSLSHRGGYRG